MKQNLKNYISSLRTPGRYDFVGEDTALAIAELYGRDVHIFSSLPNPLIFHPGSVNVKPGPIITLAFYEPAHYKALLDLLPPPLVASSEALVAIGQDLSKN